MVEKEQASPAGDSSDPWIGRTLAGYVILRRIGVGGMGVVYYGRHDSLDRAAAIKFMARHLVDDAAYIEMFLREARAAAKLNHPNIVSVYDAGCLGDEVYFFIMEYVDGCDLVSLQQKSGRLPARRVVEYVKQAAHALAYVHAKNIIHRDIKPENLMLTADGVIKVADLGLAKKMGDEGAATQAGWVLGSPNYISPERLTDANLVDARSDIYSLGATLFDLLAGRPPYLGSPPVIMSMHLHGPAPDLLGANPELDFDINDIVQKMMAKDPAARYQSMDEVEHALEQYLATPEHAHHDSPTERCQPPASAAAIVAAGAKPAGRSAPPWVWAAMATAACVIVLLFWFGGRSGSGQVVATETRAGAAETAAPKPAAIDIELPLEEPEAKPSALPVPAAPPEEAPPPETSPVVETAKLEQAPPPIPTAVVEAVKPEPPIEDVPAVRGNNHWVPTGWCGGGAYPGIEFDPSNPKRVYLISDVAGVWRSENLGDRWDFATEGLPNVAMACMAISPSDPNTLYAASERGVAVSRDGGKRWAACDSMDDEMRFRREKSVRSIMVADADPNAVCVGTRDGGVYYSEDAGKSWKMLGKKKNPWGSDSAIKAIAYRAENKSIYVASKPGIARYSLTEGKWRFLDDSPQEVNDMIGSRLRRRVLYAAAGDSVLMSDDLGQTWKKLHSFADQEVVSIDLNETLGKVTIAACVQRDWQGGVVLSRDGGKTWTEVNEKMKPDMVHSPTREWASSNSRQLSVRIHPTDPKTLFRTDFWGVWRSDDGGKSWNEKISGAANIVGSDIRVDDRGGLYIATMDCGLLKTPDRGRSFELLFPTGPHRPESHGHVWRVALLDPNGRRILATSWPWGDKVNQVLLSEDGGKNFQIVRDGLPQGAPRANTVWDQGYARALAVDPRDPKTIYLGIDGDDGGGLFISKDGGRHWAAAPAQPGSRRIYNALAVDPTDSNRIFWGATGNQGGVWMSPDRGASWQRVFSETEWVFDLAVSPTGVVYAGADANGPTLFASSDHGQSWRALKKFPGKGTVDAITVDPDRPRRVLVSAANWSSATTAGIWLSEDEGKTWTDITGDLPDGLGAAAMALDGREGWLFINRYAGMVYRTRLPR